MTWTPDQLFASKSQTWGTPQPLFDAVDSEFGFHMDAAASADNAKCPIYLTEEDNALAVSWADHLAQHGVDPAQGSVWCNPPYGRTLRHWMKKITEEAQQLQTVVALIMARTDTRWWQDHAMQCDEIRLIAGRVHFVGSAISGAAPAPSALLVFDKRYRWPQIKTVQLPRSESAKI